MLGCSRNIRHKVRDGHAWFSLSACLVLRILTFDATRIDQSMAESPGAGVTSVKEPMADSEQRASLVTIVFGQGSGSGS